MTERPWPPLDDHQADAGVFYELRVGARWADVLAILGVPVLLVTVFLTVGEPDRSLALVYAEPTPTSVVTAHFVHRSLGHLLDNLAAYALVVPTAYALAVLSATRREFLVAFAGLVVLAPPTISGLELLTVDRGVVLGFSGVTMGFVGLLALQTGTYLASHFDTAWRGNPAPALFFAGLALAAARTASASHAGIFLAGVAASIAGLYLWRTFGSVRLDATSVAGLYTQEGQFGIVALVVLAVGIVVGFPSETEATSVVVDRYGHMLGFAIGFLAPYLTFHVLGDAAGEADAPPGVA